MEIKTGHRIHFDGLDVREANKKSGYSSKTSKARKEFDEKKWVFLDDLLKWIKEYETTLGDLPKELSELKKSLSTSEKEGTELSNNSTHK